MNKHFNLEFFIEVLTYPQQREQNDKKSNFKRCRSLKQKNRRFANLAEEKQNITI